MFDMGSEDRTLDQRGCPSDGDLAAFVDHALTGPARVRLEAHLHRCEQCRETIGHVASTQDDAPRTIDRYRLDGKLGEGGMGVVWKAFDPALEREIAIKLLHPELHDSVGRERALREAKALARLQHPNVIAVYDVGEHEGDVFIATELVDGQSMDAWQKGRAPREIVAAYAQAGRGLAAAHALGLVHRDVKPSNILVARDGRVRVGDFGLATNAAASSLQRVPTPSPRRALPTLTEHGTQLGTPAYMAPEQQHTAAVDERADQFSLCLALAEALLGKMPPDEPTVKQLEASGVAAPWAAIARGLSLVPSARFASMSELVTELERAAPRSRALLLVALAAGAAVIAVLAWQLATRDTAAPSTASSPPPLAPVKPGHWIAPADGAWRLPFDPKDLGFVGDNHAIVIDFRAVALVDLATGLASPVVEIEDDELESVTEVGGRTVIFGVRDERPVAWSVAIGVNGVPALTEIEIDDPGGARDVRTNVSLGVSAVSPDGSRVVVCSRIRPPIVRDARTLQTIAHATSAECTSIRFLDQKRAVFGYSDPVVFDLAAATVTRQRKTAPYANAGPNGLVYVDDDKRSTITSGATTLYTGESLGGFDGTWSSDGAYFVTSVLGKMKVLAARSGRLVTIPEMSLVNFRVRANKTLAITTSETSLFAVELATGRVRKPVGALSFNSQIAPTNGSVISLADRLRVYRDGKVVGTGIEASAFAIGAPGSPIVVQTVDEIRLWDLATNDLTRLGDAWVDTVIARRGDTLAVATQRRGVRGHFDQPLAQWFSANQRVIALDPEGNRIAVDDDNSVYVVDLAKRTVTRVANQSHLPGQACSRPMTVQLVANGRVAAEGITQIVWIDPLAPIPNVGIQYRSGLVGPWVALPNGRDLLIAAEDTIVIIDVPAQRAVAWKTGGKATSPRGVGVDPDGTEVAVAYADGSVLWANLDSVRQNAIGVPVTIQPATLCSEPAPPIDQLLVGG